MARRRDLNFRNFQAKTPKTYTFVIPTHAKNARVGHPRPWRFPEKLKMWPPAQRKIG